MRRCGLTVKRQKETSWVEIATPQCVRSGVRGESDVSSRLSCACVFCEYAFISFRSAITCCACNAITRYYADVDTPEARRRWMQSLPGHGPRRLREGLKECCSKFE